MFVAGHEDIFMPDASSSSPMSECGVPACTSQHMNPLSVEPLTAASPASHPCNANLESDSQMCQRRGFAAFKNM